MAAVLVVVVVLLNGDALHPLLLTLHELDEGVGFARGANEAVLQQLLSRYALFGGLLETERHELLEGFGEVALEGRRRVLRDQEEDAHGVEIVVGGHTLGHLDRRDA